MGFLIGFVAGLANAGSGWSAEPETPPICPQAVAQPTAPPEDSMQMEATK